MRSETNQERTKIRRTATLYNQLVNGFWSVLSFGPLVYFCVVAMELRWLYVFLFISLTVGFLPASFFNRLRLGSTLVPYHKLGIRVIRKYTQDGDFVNALIRRRFPDYKSGQTVSIKTHLSKSVVYERFHLICLLFFALTALYALANGFWGWALLLTGINALYNGYPILLQQYNRLRFESLKKRRLSRDVTKN
ncbi:hypothetical protein GCM10027341_40270 [Spirosoma knui]